MSDTANERDRGEGEVTKGRISWFKPEKKFGFVKLENRQGDAFLHFNVLKEGGFYFLPRGTTVQVRIKISSGRAEVAQVLGVDLTTAHAGEPPAKVRRKKGSEDLGDGPAEQER